MATQALMPVEKYLRASFEREPEYRDGVLQERPMPEGIHSLLQFFLSYALGSFAIAGRLSVCGELRVKLREGRYVLPDLCIYPGRLPAAVPETPALVVVEVLSKHDSMSDVLSKLEEYRLWGVPNIWVVSPAQRAFYVFDAGDLRRTHSFTLPEFGFTLEQDELFRQADNLSPDS